MRTHRLPPLRSASLSAALRCPQGVVDVVRDFDPRATTLFPGRGQEDARAQADLVRPILDDLQGRLRAQGVDDPHAQRVLLVLQGMDTSGKGGVVRHAIAMMDPEGVRVHAFKAPTPVEREHDFLWRVRRALPEPGIIGVFDRSHYEDVLVQRVEHMASPDEIERRYGAINDFEREVAASGTRVVKCFLNISRAEQKRRLAQRLDPSGAKYWKYDPGDLDVRAKWDEYMAAYGLALQRCNQDEAPWFVIPSDHRWYRNWAVARVLAETLSSMNLTWPPARFDVARERERVANS
ncbi:MAG: polyphosphate kinase 2 family protein [Propionibacteriaceae bacterium]|nr:polyphosphate kinase 2 family protein [Propionibacteriaceae bacterium]